MPPGRLRRHAEWRERSRRLVVRGAESRTMFRVRFPGAKNSTLLFDRDVEDDSLAGGDFRSSGDFDAGGPRYLLL